MTKGLETTCYRLYLNAREVALITGDVAKRLS